MKKEVKNALLLVLVCIDIFLNSQKHSVMEDFDLQIKAKIRIFTTPNNFKKENNEK